MRGPKLAGWALMCVAGVGMLAVGPLVACGPPECPSPDDYHHGVFIQIGEFQTKDAGMRAAIKRLVIETERCPDAQLYRIVWIGPVSDDDPTARQSIDRRALLYSGDEPAKGLAYELHVLSGTTGRTYMVDRTDIQAVAAKGGTLEDFDQYDQSPRSNRKDGS